jgi:hypothetical protein
MLDERSHFGYMESRFDRSNHARRMQMIDSERIQRVSLCCMAKVSSSVSGPLSMRRGHGLLHRHRSLLSLMQVIDRYRDAVQMP